MRDSDGHAHTSDAACSMRGSRVPGGQRAPLAPRSAFSPKHLAALAHHRRQLFAPKELLELQQK